MPDRWLQPLLWPVVILLAAGCAAVHHPKPGPAIDRGCVPACLRAASCGELDARLVAARQPLLTCVGRRSRRGHLAAAHRCYRALRLLESARWWLKSLLGEDELLTVYQPAESVRREFLCRIEALARARTAGEVEAIYLDMIRSYP